MYVGFGVGLAVGIEALPVVLVEVLVVDVDDVVLGAVGVTGMYVGFGVGLAVGVKALPVVLVEVLLVDIVVVATVVLVVPEPPPHLQRAGLTLHGHHS